MNRLTNPRADWPRPDSSRRRVVDVLVGFTGLALCWPVLLGIAFVVRVTSRGPALYRQSRVGRDGVLFPICKFRTMVTGADRNGQLVSGRDDPRITRIGHWLRATRLDELPQLINVARGEMTIVGPRPEVPDFLPHYTSRELRVLRVRPGVIGPGAILFAVEQCHELDRAADPSALYLEQHLHAKLDLDLAYLAHRSVGRDLSLLVRTAALVAA